MAATDVKNDANLSTSLVSYWRLEEATAATTWVDAHTGGNNLTNSSTGSGVTSATGIQGNCADFEEASDEYLYKDDPSSWNLDISGDMSVAGWVNFETAMGSGAQVFFLGRDSGQPNRNWYFGFLDVGGTDGVSMYNSSDGSNTNTTSWVRVAYGSGFSTSTWYHVAWVYDASAGQLEAYVNGTSLGTASGLKTSMYTGGTARLVLGQYSPNPAANIGFDGKADDIGVWSKTLTATEVSDLYNGGAGIPYEAAGGAVNAGFLRFM